MQWNILGKDKSPRFTIAVAEILIGGKKLTYAIKNEH